MKADRISISARSDLLEEARAWADKSGLSLSAWLADAAIAKLTDERLGEFVEDWISRSQREAWEREEPFSIGRRRRRAIPRADKISISLPSDLGAKVRSHARKADKTVSAWLGEAAAAKVRNEGLREVLDEYQAEFGAFSEEEI